jgi:hypothetical protein
MQKNNDRIVYKNSEGLWANKSNSASKAAGLHKKQEQAVQEAKLMLENSGGGELIIKGLDGKIRSKDTIEPGNDPRKIKDTEH